MAEITAGQISVINSVKQLKMAEITAGQISDITSVTSVTTFKYIYILEWVIDYECITGKNVGDILKSPVFTTGSVGKSHYKWQLSLYPNGSSEACKNFVSINLKLLSNAELKVNASFRIVTNGGKVVKLFENTMDYSENRNWGLTKFVKSKSIERSENDTLHDYNIKITCEIVIHKKVNNIQMMDYGRELVQLSTDFEQLIDDDEFNDVEFAIDGKQLRANKSILGKRSRTFAAMFDNKIREKREKRLQITDVRHEVFQEMLRYIYSGKVKGIEKMAGELLAAADKYTLDGLKVMCEHSLSYNINAENVLDTIRLAYRHRLGTLKTKTIEFIVTQVVPIVDKPEFRQLPYNIVCDICSALAQKIK